MSPLFRVMFKIRPPILICTGVVGAAVAGLFIGLSIGGPVAVFTIVFGTFAVASFAGAQVYLFRAVFHAGVAHGLEMRLEQPDAGEASGEGG